MVVGKRNKRSRYRGSHTHGGGAKKKRRGAGNRGGRGRGGFGKRGQQRMPTAQARKEKLGKRGFIHHGVKKDLKGINLGDFSRLLEKGLVKNEGVVDLNKLGYKLLSSGDIKVKIQVKGQVSKKAEEKIIKAGGEVLKEAQRGKASGAPEGEKKVSETREGEPLAPRKVASVPRKEEPKGEKEQ
ncbi:MAG: uL15 family ribosomal protein [Nanoarchaeota archaeon]|nr:uL15 family ribosomal protein [Nanoarchaeota archaeon]